MSSSKWNSELEKLRQFCLESGLTEEEKWGQAVYTWQGKNVIVLHAFKDNCTIGFFKGSLLTDAHGILEKPGKNTQGPMVM